MAETITIDTTGTGEDTEPVVDPRVKVDGNKATIDTSKPAPKAEEKPKEGDAEDFAGLGSLDELKKSYTELRTKLSQGNKASAKAEEPKGPLVDLNALAAEYMKDGKLSEETVKSLNGKGFSQDMIDTFIAGRKAQADVLVNEITSAAGSKEEVANVLTFVKDNATPEDIAAYNKAVDSGDTVTAKRIFQSFVADYRASDGEPNLITGGTGGKGIAPYESWAQVSKDMAKPEYKNDPAFAAQVAAKLNVSDPSKFKR